MVADVAVTFVAVTAEMMAPLVVEKLKLAEVPDTPVELADETSKS
jgi:hypothetical protein